MFKVKDDNNPINVISNFYFTYVCCYMLCSVQETLYYHLRALYNFRTLVSDIGNNEGSFITIIEVQDMPNREPMWIRAFASARFPEKEPKVRKRTNSIDRFLIGYYF